MIRMKNKGVMISLAAVIVIGILITKSTYRFVERSDIPGGIRLEENQDTGGERAMAAAEEPGQPQPFSIIDGGGEEAGPGAGYGEEEGISLLSEGQESFEEKAEDRMGQAKSREAESISPLDTTAAELSADSGDTAGMKSVEDGTLLYYKKRLQDLDAQIEKSRGAQNGSNLNSSAKSAASSELKLWDSELNTIYNEILERLDKEGSEILVEEQRGWLKERDSLAMEAAKNSAGGSRESVEYTVSLAGSTRQRAYDLVEIYAAVLAD